jgi:hypothetical protein
VRYRLALDYRHLAGSPPRLCVWEEPLNRCAKVRGLASRSSWQKLDVTFLAHEGTTGLQLFLYSDGDGVTTVNEYRSPELGIASPTALVALPTSRALPVVQSTRVSPSEFRVRVSGATAPFLLVLTEGNARGWELHASGLHGQARHVTVDGYANGWLVPWRGTYQLTLVYGPETEARLARRASLAAIPLGLLLLVRLGVRDRRRRRPQPPA